MSVMRKSVDLQNEVRPGGSYSYHITRNGKEFLQDGEYLKIDRPKTTEFYLARSREEEYSQEQDQLKPRYSRWENETQAIDAD